MTKNPRWDEPRLVLTIKVGDSVQIGEINVEVVSKKGDQIRLGIKAPRDLRISRRHKCST